MAKSFPWPAFRLRVALVPLLLAVPWLAHSQDLNIATEDLRLELRPDGGFHLFIRHRPDISSVLLTETTRDPLFREPNFAYRAPEWNEVNGDEIRLVNGIPITRESGIHSLVSSTPVWHPALGWAFHVYVPPVLLYGYEGGRQGEVHVADGIYLNIRAFHFAHADYRGPFADNPFMLKVVQEFARPSPDAGFMNETVEAFTSLAGAESTAFVSGPAEMMERIVAILGSAPGSDLDIAICLDVTSSMRPFFGEIRDSLVPALREMASGFASVRGGMVFFKDYYDDFMTKLVPFTDDFDELQAGIDGVKVGGGGDIPEAVHEALYVGATGLEWEGRTRIMILIGDAPPHPRPRGRVTRQMVDAEIERRQIKLHSIVLPHP